MKNTILGSVITLVIVGLVLGNGILIAAGAGFLAGILVSEGLKKFEKKGKNSIENIQTERVEKVEQNSGVKYDSKVEEKYRQLKMSFNEFYDIALFKENADLTITQLERTKEKFERFINILNEKFDKEEISYSKFLQR